MMKIISIVLLFCISLLNAQNNWIVKSDDSLVIAKNYMGFAEGRDSAIVVTKSHKFIFSYHYPLFKEEIIDQIDGSFWVMSIKRINDEVYLLVGVGGNENFETQLSLIFINESKILKYIVIKSIDKRLRDIEYLFDEKNKEFVFTRGIVNINDEIPIYDLDIDEQKIRKIMPLKENLSEYKTKFVHKFSRSWDKVYYKIIL